MFWMILGTPLFLVGALMMFRGWNYSLHPEGPMALRRKARNIELGFPSDMKLFGRKVRRLGTILAVVGGALCSAGYW